MSTSGITSWPMTFEELATQAAYELGAVAQGESPTGEEIEDMQTRFNLMLKTWAGEGNLYREHTGTLVITGGTGAGTLPADVREVNSVRHVVSATNHRMLAPWVRAEFYVLPNRAAVGNPTCYYVGKTVSGVTINIWPVPAADITLDLDYSRAAEIVTDINETIDVPEEWQEALLYGLAGRSAGIFGTTRTDPGTVARIDARAAALYQKLLDRDRPDSYYFEPDY